MVTVSVTDLSAYLFCPRTLYLRRVLKIVPPPREVMVKGTIKHAIIDLMNRREQTIVTSVRRFISYPEVYHIYKTTYGKLLRMTILNNHPALAAVGISDQEMFRLAWPMVLRETEERAQHLFQFVKTNQIFGEELWDRLEPKIKSELSITSDKLQLNGVVDQIRIYPDKIVPYELKSGKTPPEGEIWKSHKIQLTGYALLLEESFGRPINEGIIRYLDAERRTSHEETLDVIPSVHDDRILAINPFLRDEVKALIQKVQILLSSPIVPPKCPEKKGCKECMADRLSSPKESAPLES
ncbi:Dna2/Cas4 domain-containing protein [Candidatus Woesearchaeota archaeon]|nr:Dna2/Cas4 domain-containing protein [Candidatus Woesearchaeota archaeon]